MTFSRCSVGLQPTDLDPWGSRDPCFGKHLSLKAFYDRTPSGSATRGGDMIPACPTDLVRGLKAPTGKRDIQRSGDECQLGQLRMKLLSSGVAIVVST